MENVLTTKIEDSHRPTAEGLLDKTVFQFDTECSELWTEQSMLKNVFIQSIVH